MSVKNAALTVGIAFITSLVLVTIVDDFLLANFVVPGDTAQLSADIQQWPRQFYWAAVGYLIVLALDTIIGMAVYVVLKPAHKTLATSTAVLRIAYALLLVLGTLALLFQKIGAYGYASIKSVGYLFFALHLLTLGYTIFRSTYLPKAIGIFLMIASLTYVVFFVDVNLPEPLILAIMLFMAIAELSLSIWLITKRNKLPEFS